MGSLKVVASKLLSRPVIRPALGFSSRSFCTNCVVVPDSKDDRSVVNLHDSRGVTNLRDVFNRLSPTRKLIRYFQRINYLPAEEIKPYDKKETAECLYLYIHMKGVGHEDVKVSVDRNTVLIQGEAADESKAIRGFKKYVCWFDFPDIDLPDKIYKISDIKAEMKKDDGELKLTIPKFKKEERVFNVKAS